MKCKVCRKIPLDAFLRGYQNKREPFKHVVNYTHAELKEAVDTGCARALGWKPKVLASGASEVWSIRISVPLWFHEPVSGTSLKAIQPPFPTGKTYQIGSITASLRWKISQSRR
jgi:hypothetical protein